MERRNEPSGDGYYWFKFMDPSSDPRGIQIVRVRNTSPKGSPPHYHVDFIETGGHTGFDCASMKDLSEIKGSWWGPIEKPTE